MTRLYSISVHATCSRRDAEGAPNTGKPAELDLYHLSKRGQGQKGPSMMSSATLLHAQSMH